MPLYYEVTHSINVHKLVDNSKLCSHGTTTQQHNKQIGKAQINSSSSKEKDKQKSEKFTENIVKDCVVMLILTEIV
eukprot:1235251-Amphidinium_carterae.1